MNYIHHDTTICSYIQDENKIKNLLHDLISTSSSSDNLCQLSRGMHFLGLIPQSIAEILKCKLIMNIAPKRLKRREVSSGKIFHKILSFQINYITITSHPYLIN